MNGRPTLQDQRRDVAGLEMHAPRLQRSRAPTLEAGRCGSGQARFVWTGANDRVFGLQRSVRTLRQPALTTAIHCSWALTSRLDWPWQPMHSTPADWACPALPTGTRRWRRNFSPSILRRRISPACEASSKAPTTDLCNRDGEDDDDKSNADSRRASILPSISCCR
jgi:hypothetical protein